MIAITLIELDNCEAPNIGTIISNTTDEEELVKKATKAIESHFDAKVTSIKIQDGLGFSDVKNSPPLDVVVRVEAEVGEEDFKIEIQQTWVY